MKFNFLIILFLLTSSCNFFLISQTRSLSSEAFGDRLIIGVVGKRPIGINPFIIDDAIQGQIAKLIFGSGLIQRADRFGQPGNLIDRFIVIGSNKFRGIIWPYVLKRNIIYQNGIALRNEDVKFTFDVLKKWGGHLLNRGIDLSNLSSIETKGDLEVQFSLKQKDNFFDQKLSDIPILSQYYYQGIALQGYDLFKKIRPIGYGPFQFERSTDSEIVLHAHENYVFGSPFLEFVIYKFFPDKQKMLDEFIQDKVDLVEIEDQATAYRLHQVLENNIKIFQTIRPEKKVFFILFNTNSDPFNDSKVRIAIKGAVNQSEIVQQNVGNSGHIAYSVIDYTNSLFYKELFRESYNPGKSLRILQSIGWSLNKSDGLLEKLGKELSFNLIFEKNSHLEENIARTIKIQLGELGINVKPQPLVFSDKERVIKQNQFEAVLVNYSYYDLNLYEVIKNFYFDILKNSNYKANYFNPTIEKLFKQADKDTKLRKQFVRRYQIFLRQDSPVVFLYFDDKIIYGVKSRFQNVRVSFSSGSTFYYRLSPFENWFVPKSLQKYK